MRLISIIAASSAALTLAACGDSSDSAEDYEVPAGYEDLAGLIEANDNDELGEATAAQMSGTATLEGAMAIYDIGEDEDLELIGDLAMTADFTNSTVDGTADGFDLYDVESGTPVEAITGSLTVDGVIMGSLFEATADGTLSDSEDDYGFELDMTGEFADYEGDLAATGDIEGEIDGEYHEGGFVAVEN